MIDHGNMFPIVATGDRNLYRIALSRCPGGPLLLEDLPRDAFSVFAFQLHEFLPWNKALNMIFLCPGELFPVDTEHKLV